MGKALYRKYRSKSLAEIIGQEHITQTLDHALKQGMISHAYLFTGPRGTGKTSIARILAHEVNNLPYSEQIHMDIIEIDAASNRRIDEIRELKERVNTAPTSAKYKVYIIDEVHMLTKEAFNALLKTLEEPPDHVIFILATTEAHKVPETIISRTQRFTFKPVPIDKVVEHLQQIAHTEQIKIDTDALELIAAHGGGSFRDSISLLDQVRHTANHITLQNIQQAIGQAPDELLSTLLSSLSTGSLPTIAASLATLQNQGIQPHQVARQLSQILRRSILQSSPAVPVSQALQLLQDLLEVNAAPDPGLKLELAIYAIAINIKPITGSADSSRVTKEPVPERQSTPLQKPKLTAKAPIAPQPTPQKAPVPEPASKTAKPQTSTDLDAETWALILNAIKAKHNTLYGITRMAIPQFEPGKVTLSFAFAFHQKRLDDSKNKQLLMKIINEVTGQNVSIICILDAPAQNRPIPEIAEKLEKPEEIIDLQAISNIFGSAEVVD